MKAPDSLAALLEAGFNRYLELHPEAEALLVPMHGRIIALEILGLDLRLYLVPDPAGIQVLAACEAAPDCTLRGTPLALARLREERERADQLFSGGVELEGDTDLGHSFGKLLGSMDVDWEEQLSRVTGDVLAHQAGSLVRGAARWGRKALDALRQDLPEYLQEEVRLLPGRDEMEFFLSEVDRVRDDSDRLEKRLQRLRQKTLGARKPQE